MVRGEVGFFSGFSGAGKQRDRLHDLKSELTSSMAWNDITDSPLFGTGIRVGFAFVDCRECMKTEAGLLLDQTIWNWQTHKVSYSTCIDNPGVWAAENQGPQQALTKMEWLQTPYGTYEETSSIAKTWQAGRKTHEVSFESLEEWIMKDFMSRGFELKTRLANLLRKKGNADDIEQLEAYLAAEGLDI
jgi:hypothetical protein